MQVDLRSAGAVGAGDDQYSARCHLETSLVSRDYGTAQNGGKGE